MDPVTIIGLVSNIISFIDFGRKLLTDVREIRDSAAGVTQEALSHEFIAQQMRDFANKLIPQGNVVDGEYKGIISLAKECCKAAEDIQKLLEKMKPRDSGSLFQSLGSAIKGLRYGKEIANLQGKMNRYRDQLLVQLNWVTTSELKDQMAGLARDFDKNGDRIIRLQKQVEDLNRTITTGDDQLRQGIQDLLGLSHRSHVTVHSHRLLENLRFDEMNARFETVPYAHERTFEWIFSRHDSSSENDEGYSDEEEDSDDEVSDEEYKDRDASDHEKIREEFTSWLTSEDGIYHISGKLGSGKSALMKFLYLDSRTKDMLKKWAGHETLIMAHFFFWRPGSRLQHSVQGLYRALLYKTLSTIPTLVPEVLPEQWQEIQSKPWQVNVKVDFPLKTLQQALSRLMCCQSKDLRICFFIDGLDECKDDERKENDTDQHRHLARSLSRWCGKSGGRVKICASSREYNVFLENLPSKRRLHMQHLTEEDMKLYIRDRLSFAQQAERWLKLMHSIIKKANGIFLWVALVTSRLQYLHESKVGWDILHKEIDQAPEGLYDLFSHVIQSLATSDLRRAYQTFEIIQVLGQYGLPLPLLSYPFIDHYTGDSDVDSCEIFRQERIPERDCNEQARGMLMGYCGGLFEPTHTSYREIDPEAIISFTHRSVPEFIDSLDTKEKEKYLRDFCAEDAASYLCLAYLWAKDIGDSPQEMDEEADQKWLSYITFHVTSMRKAAKIGKAPFHFEEQMWSVLTRLGARTITDQDPYGEIIIPTDIDLGSYYMIARNITHPATDRAYVMSHPFYLSARAGNWGYVQWKLTHDPSVAPTPFHLVLLFSCLIHVYREEPATFYQILDKLRERGLSPQTMTTLSWLSYNMVVNHLEITVWQQLIMSAIIGMSWSLFIWRWFLENGADPHFIISVPNEEWPSDSLTTVTLVLGRERRRGKVYLQHDLGGPVTSKKYPNPDGTGVRMTLVDIIREEHFEDEEELIELVERKMRLFGNEPEKAESSR